MVKYSTYMVYHSMSTIVLHSTRTMVKFLMGNEKPQGCIRQAEVETGLRHSGRKINQSESSVSIMSWGKCLYVILLQDVTFAKIYCWHIQCIDWEAFKLSEVKHLLVAMAWL